jgi:hypothetical protein
MPPAVAPEGDLVSGKAKLPFNFINLLILYIWAANWGVEHVIYNRKLGNPR